jgi:shikimate kinase
MSPSRRALTTGNLVLIGMFGSGKSTVGRILAKKLHYRFVDVDHLMQEKRKKPLQKVLDGLGMRGFMRLEERTILGLRSRGCVIAPGGSAVYYPRGMAHLKKLGKRIYLKVSLAELKKRMPDWSNRGVVCRGGNTLAALYRERGPLFRRYSDLTVETRGKSAEEIALEILKKIE